MAAHDVNSKSWSKTRLTGADVQKRRIILDILTLARSSGRTDGIVRTVRALGRFAVGHRDDVVLAVYDLEIGAFRPVRSQWIDAVLDGAKIDTSHFSDPQSRKPRLREKLPHALKRLAFAIQRPRRFAFLATERLRLNSLGNKPLLDRVQNWLLSQKYLAELTDVTGRRRTLLPFDMATGPALRLGPADVVFQAGSDWSVMMRVAETIPREGARLAVLCHDIIPLLFPQFFPRNNAETFRACFHAIFPAANLVIFTTRRVESDAQRYCGDNGLRINRTAKVALGADFEKIAADKATPLPAGLESDRYALFVSTLEPRKGHRLLLAVWRRLREAGIPQAHTFKLVFVGRQGWDVADLIADMRSDPSFGDSLLWLSDVNDEMLTTLYSQAAFCLYPSIYEGFGLPVIEAFQHGKAVVASTGGALPETIGRFSPCIDPFDERGWLDILTRWIEDPAERLMYETAIAAEFSVRGWDDFASEAFETLDRES